MRGILGIALLLFGVQMGFGVRLQIYRDYNRVGLIADISITPEAGACNALPTYAAGVAGSVKTDTCLMVYDGAECNGNSAKIVSSTVNTNRIVRSWRACEGALGGDAIRLNLYGTESVLLTEYLDACYCHDLPTQISTDLLKMNNFGNCVSVFEQSSCRGQSKDIQAGQNGDTENMRNLPFIVRSLSACGTNPACLRLEAVIDRFDLVFPYDQPEHLRHIDLAPPTRLYNNGNASIVKDYTASKTVRQVYSVARSRPILNMWRISTDPIARIESNPGWQGFGSAIAASITNALKNGYSRGQEKAASDTFVYEEEKTFSDLQTLQMPACSEYEVSSTLQLLENVEISYWLYARIRGTASGVQLNAEELKNHITDMEFVKNLDDHTAVFRSSHIIRANVGFDTWINAAGTELLDCVMMGQ